MTSAELASIPRGNTCDGVNRTIIERLLATGRDFAGATLLDVPCGQGVLVQTLQRFFPRATVLGGDLVTPAAADTTWFHALDASQPGTLPGQRPAAICCVSGVMEFDNTLQFFSACRRHLAQDGLFLVTNDNLVTVRDRLGFLVLGKTRRFDLWPTPGQPTWKSLSLPNLLRLLHDAGFHVRSIHYVGAKPKDWLFLPLAALLWPTQWLHRTFARTSVAPQRRREMFPFRSLLCRHYVVEAHPRPEHRPA